MTGQASGSYRKEIIFVFALALSCYVAWQVRDVLVLVYVSGLFGVVLRPLVRSFGEIRIGKKKPFKRIAILVLLVAVAGLLITFASLALPPVVRDLQEFSKEMPTRGPAVIEHLKHLPFADQVDLEDLESRVQDFIGNAATYIVLSIRSWAGKLFSVVTGIILTIYFILEGETAYAWFLSLVPLHSRDRLDATLQRAEARMGRWLLGQGSLMLILGISSTIVYLALGVRYAYALGALTGLLNVIPIFGAAISIVLTLLVSALDSWGRVLGVAIFYLVYLQVENSYLVPRIMRSRVGLPGLAILVALLLGSALAGIVGAMVSVPTAVLVAELIDEYLVKKPAKPPEPVATAST